jgi:putative FmdB family regulatory protein
MPFYEYECPSCKRQTEVMQKISDKPLKKCPSCGKAGLRRLISAPVFRLKGSGWYETDFKSDKEGKRNLAGGDEAPAAKDEAQVKATAKVDGKAEGKADSKADSKAGSDSAATAKPGPKPEPKGVAKSSSSKSRARPAAKQAAARRSKPAARKGGKR